MPRHKRVHARLVTRRGHAPRVLRRAPERLSALRPPLDSGERSKGAKPGRRNAPRERDGLFDMVREIVARIERSEIRGRWFPHFAALNAGYEATIARPGRGAARAPAKRCARDTGRTAASYEEPTFTCGRLRSIVSGLLFTMKTATRTCEPSARGAMELDDSVRAVSSLTVRSNAWARHKLMLVPARQIWPHDPLRRPNGWVARDWRWE